MGQDLYESDALLAQYLLLHYGEPRTVLPYAFGPVDALDYPVRCVTELLDSGRLQGNPEALDLGCAVGRSSCELARTCYRVVGIDLSRRFIGIARKLCEDGVVRWRCPVEGDFSVEIDFRLPADVMPERITFEVGDACNLRPDLGAFDVVLNANLVDRLPRPDLFLAALPRLVKPGGQLLLASPFTWLEEYTAREHWIGGHADVTDAERSWDVLCQRLSADFELDFETDLPFLIREHARKFQWSVAKAGRWLRRS